MSKKILIVDMGLLLYNAVLLFISRILYDNKILYPYNYPLHILFAVLLICGAVGFWIFSYNAECKNVSRTNIAISLVPQKTPRIVGMIFSLRRWAMFIKNTQNEKLNKSFATDFSNNLILIFIGSVLNKNPNFIKETTMATKPLIKTKPIISPPNNNVIVIKSTVPTR